MAPSSSKRVAPVRASLAKTLAEKVSLNAILSGLDRSDLKAVIDQGSLVNLRVKHQIYQPEEVIETVYFPIDSVLSIVSRMEDGRMIEVGTIGREGMTALPLLLGATATANECYCQIPGSAFRISAKLFVTLRASATFRQLLDRYVQGYVNMLGQLAACNRLHSVYERCARWLLLSEDRVGTPVIRLTHEYLAMMLGTQRSGVTIAAGMLQQAGFISYGRGVITVLDRVGLEGATCECYGVSRKQFAGLLRSVNGHPPNGVPAP